MAEIIDILGVAGSITTVISLAALSLLVAFLLAGKWLSSRQKQIESAIATGNKEIIDTIFERYEVRDDKLGRNEQFELARKSLAERGRARLVVYFLSFFALIALLAFIVILIVFSPRDNEPVRKLGLLEALEVLTYVKPDERAAVCPQLLTDAECTNASVLLSDMPYRQPDAKEDAIVEQAVKQGGLSETQLKQVASCGGDARFVVRNSRLFCQDGSQIAFLGQAGSERPLGRPIAIVFHYTATASKDAEGLGRRLAAGLNDRIPGPLTHILIAKDGGVFQTAGFDQMALHVGRAEPWRGIEIVNGNSLAIELVNSGMPDDNYTDAQIAAAIGVARSLVQAFGIEYIVGHSDLAPGRRTDPGVNFPMDRVRAAALGTS